MAALIQVAVVVLTAAGAKGPSYLTEGRLTKLGSGLLHLGFIAFAIVVAALQPSSDDDRLLDRDGTHDGGHAAQLLRREDRMARSTAHAHVAPVSHAENDIEP